MEELSMAAVTGMTADAVSQTVHMVHLTGAHSSSHQLAIRSKKRLSDAALQCSDRPYCLRLEFPIPGCLHFHCYYCLR